MCNLHSFLNTTQLRENKLILFPKEQLTLQEKMSGLIDLLASVTAPTFNDTKGIQLEQKIT